MASITISPTYAYKCITDPVSNKTDSFSKREDTYLKYTWCLKINTLFYYGNVHSVNHAFSIMPPCFNLSISSSTFSLIAYKGGYGTQSILQKQYYSLWVWCGILYSLPLILIDTANIRLYLFKTDCKLPCYCTSQKLSRLNLKYMSQFDQYFCLYIQN